MLYLVLALVVLGLISAIFGIISHRKGEDEEPLQEGFMQYLQRRELQMRTGMHDGSRHQGNRILR